MFTEMGVVWTQAVVIPAPLQNTSTSLTQFRVQISLQREGALLGMAQQSQNMTWVGVWVVEQFCDYLCSKHSPSSSEDCSSHCTVQ